MFSSCTSNQSRDLEHPLPLELVSLALPTRSLPEIPAQPAQCFVLVVQVQRRQQSIRVHGCRLEPSASSGSPSSHIDNSPKPRLKHHVRNPTCTAPEPPSSSRPHHPRTRSCKPLNNQPPSLLHPATMVCSTQYQADKAASRAQQKPSSSSKSGSKQGQKLTLCGSIFSQASDALPAMPQVKRCGYYLEKSAATAAPPAAKPAHVSFFNFLPRNVGTWR
ncbi:hypothetical protein CT0861_12445 [Colletotrichum tofieldiae]|uniref:Uncharacterized protein n=1 Tax=Colletotrichum tofieldiae TaxID=708197 RepID=A0A166LRJ1_9PEZI|nr:hypothetical protein CT0861_12445 [Colletotrichum tofieldiae]